LEEAGRAGGPALGADLHHRAARCELASQRASPGTLPGRVAPAPRHRPAPPAACPRPCPLLAVRRRLAERAAGRAGRGLCGSGPARHVRPASAPHPRVGAAARRGRRLRRGAGGAGCSRQGVCVGVCEGGGGGVGGYSVCRCGWWRRRRR
jgi:hypothetical protein